MKDKEFDFSFAFGDLGRFRVNAFHERGNLAAALRLIPNEIPTIPGLGLPKIVEKFSEFPRGLVLVTGPTGSGKSTTLAALVDKINEERSHQILINIETNGTIPLKENLMDMASVEFGDYTDLPITFTVSPKLHNSGEEEIARRPYLLIENSDFFDDYPPIIKAVVADEAGVRELIHILDQTHRTSPRHHIYLMAEAATPEQLAVNGPKVAALAKSQGWSYSNRLHLTLYGNAPGT
jgi:organic radical activating enzyme